MSFVKLATRLGGGTPLTGVSVALNAMKTGKPRVQLTLGVDVMKQLKVKLGDKVVVEAGVDEHEGQLRLGKDPLGRKIMQVGKSETGRITFKAWRAFAVKEAAATSCETRIAKGLDEPDKLQVFLPASWIKGATAAAVPVSTPRPRDVSATVFGPNGNGGRR